MKKESVDCRRVAIPEGWPPPTSSSWYLLSNLLENPGDFFWIRDREGNVTELLIWIPGDQGGTVAPIPVRRTPQGQDDNGIWYEWNGDEERPTLKPSIERNRGCKSGRNYWHGHLDDGCLVSCP